MSVNDTARPAKRYRVDEYVYGEDLMPGDYVLAADYDALREDRDKWRQTAAENFVIGKALNARAEAAEATIGRVRALPERVRTTSLDGVKSDALVIWDDAYNECLARVRAALNEGGGGGEQ